MTRNDTKVIQIGSVKIGGGNPVAIQSMTNTKTEDVEATVKRDARSYAVLYLRWKLQKH